MPESRFQSDQREWLAQQFEGLTTKLEILTPSQWAERRRYLPQSVTPLPGRFRFDVCPYMREIADCMSVDSPIREVSVMKGAQITATTAILENTIGYCVDAVKSAPVMMVTADDELAKIRIDTCITPMLQLSELSHLIKSADETNRRKTGKTAKKIEWVGGGFLLPFGALNAAKLRSMSIQVLLRDEIDAWPEALGKDGDPIALSAARTDAYEGSRKILDLSTPLIKGTSKIAKRFELGDQRYYHVCCLGCAYPQTLRWRRENRATGEESGIMWDVDAHGRLIVDSVRYRCCNCGHDHVNDDKHKLLSPDNGAEWRPSAEPARPDHRSYHLSALYSPVGMKTWTSCVQDWLEAWDEERGRVKHVGKLQVFYNNVLGLPFEIRGQELRFEQVSSTRRQAYSFGQIPNDFARAHCGSPILVVTAAVDVHKDQIIVGTIGWCPGPRGILLDYWRWEGDTEQLTDPNTWGRLRKFLEQPHQYAAPDGRRYRIQLTLIDSGYRTEQVYRFCARYAGGVAPVKGREGSPGSAAIREFAQFKTPMGTRAFHVFVDLFKDRWSAALRHPWDGEGLQPYPSLNTPVDVTDAQLRELTVEVRREKHERLTGRVIGYEWHRPSGAANELWDLLIYANAALDMVAWDVCSRHLKLEVVDWTRFWELAKAGQ